MAIDVPVFEDDCDEQETKRRKITHSVCPYAAPELIIRGGDLHMFLLVWSSISAAVLESRA